MVVYTQKCPDMFSEQFTLLKSYYLHEILFVFHFNEWVVIVTSISFQGTFLVR